MKLAGMLRLGFITLCLGLLEIGCRTGIVNRFAIVPPSEMAVGAWNILLAGTYNVELFQTFSSILIAGTCAVVLGFLIGAVLHAWPRGRRAADPYLAAFYAIPLFVFYPTFILMFGLNRVPIILVALLKGLVAVIISTMDGLDRVPGVQLKVARTMHLDAWRTTFLVKLPSAIPYFLGGVKFAFAYGILGVLGSEFILANHGIGYEISYAFNDFKNTRMYSLILIVLVLVLAMNALLSSWERRVLKRRGLID